MLLTEKNMEIFTKELCLECPDAPMDECPCGCMKKAIRNALQEGFEALKEKLVSNTNTVQPEPGWISVKDRLPNDNQRVIVYRPDMSEIDVGDISIQWGWNCKRKKTDITHWMPLPEPPKDD